MKKKNIYKNQPGGLKILDRLLHKSIQEGAIGDFIEQYFYIVKTKGAMMAMVWYITQVLQLFINHIKSLLVMGANMGKNYFITTMRNLLRHKGYSFINIFGLIIGLTSAILISMYVSYELSFDRYHENAKYIYRIIQFQEGNRYMGSEWFNSSPAGLKAAVVSEIPEVIKSTRAYERPSIVKKGTKVIRENQIRFVDPEFLDIFTYPLLEGNKKTVLSKPFSVLLSQDMKTKYFPDENPIGKTLTMHQQDFQVTGIFENVPKNSHFTFDFLVSIDTLYSLGFNRDLEKKWTSNELWNTYILVKKGCNITDLKLKLDQLVKKHLGDKSKTRYHPQPLSRIHLHSRVNFDASNISDIRYVYLFSAIVFLILVIASVNYINLTTSRSWQRAKEVAVRKVVGAHKKTIVRQFLMESTIFILLAVIISIVLTLLLLPYFSQFIGRDLSMSLLLNGNMLATLFFIILVVGILSGSYPALFLSRFKPILILKSTIRSKGKRKPGLRNILVVVQFIVSILLIVCSLVIYWQLEYIRNKNLGFNKDHIVYGIGGRGLIKNFKPFKQALLQHPDISDVYLGGRIPVNIRSNTTPRWQGKKKNEGFLCYDAPVDYNFIDFFNIKLVKGRNFSKNFTTDLEEAWILNEAAVKKIGWENPIGKNFYFSYNSKKGRVVGVIKDFHNTSLKLDIEPMALHLVGNKTRPYYAIKIKSNKVDDILKFLGRKVKEFSPDYPFRFYFLDETVDRMYRSEKMLGEIFGFFTMFAIFISCLGLLGLVSYTAQQKTREIGIRKVLGASRNQLLSLISKEFLYLILVANLIAWPIGWYAMASWLANFAYRINMNPLLFIGAGAITLVFALITISYQTLKAASTNPVKTLKYE
jgi:putative ABC transport system permease protein